MYKYRVREPAVRMAVSRCAEGGGAARHHVVLLLVQYSS